MEAASADLFMVHTKSYRPMSAKVRNSPPRLSGTFSISLLHLSLDRDVEDDGRPTGQENPSGPERSSVNEAEIDSRF
jgi:hypothetical protein